MKTIHHIFDIAAPPEKVFTALALPDGIAEWWTTGVEAESSLAVNSPLHLTFGKGYVLNMRVTEFERNALVNFKCLAGPEPWAGSNLRFALEAQDGGTLVRFWQHYSPEPSDDTYGFSNFHWVSFLESLRLFCQTDAGRPFEAVL
jgi:uncharacterized protein YndB with AHSA1/START domain